MTHRFEVRLIVEVDAYDASDAMDLVQDAFAIGETCGLDVVECEYSQPKGD